MDFLVFLPSVLSVVEFSTMTRALEYARGFGSYAIFERVDTEPGGYSDCFECVDSTLPDFPSFTV